MLKKFKNNFKKLPSSNKSMIYLMWIYNAWWIVISVFINIYVFSLQKSIIDVLIYNSIYFSFTSIWFIGVWSIMSILGKNIKNMYYFAYSFFILGFLTIFLVNWYTWIYLFASIYWLWFWMYWCAVHTQELVNIKDKTRDIYSSIIWTWKNIITIFMPLFISGIFFVVWKNFDFSPYLVIFLILPFIYMVSFIFIHNIWDYKPNKVNFSDFRYFFDLKKYLFWQLYFMFTWMYQALLWSIFPIIAITLLKTEVNVWLFEWIISFLTIFIIIFISNKRNQNNRVKIMWILSILLFINIIIFSFNFNIVWYIIFTLISLVLRPLYRISEHIFDLKLMDTIKIKWSDFYPTMIFREVSLFLWRLIMLIVLFFMINNNIDIEEILRLWLFLTGSIILLAWVSISLHMKYENKGEN